VTQIQRKTWPYFAFGSNLWIPRLQARTPSAEFTGLGYITCHQLTFHKRGDDGSGKCDAFYTGNHSDRTYGALYYLDPAEKPILDSIEGVGFGYELKHVEVQGFDSPIQAWLYSAQDGFRDPTMVPFDWYHRFVHAGAQALGFPEPYLSAIAAQPIAEDPNPIRRAKNLAMLSNLALF